MNQEELKKILPHRDNMLLIDECETVDGEAHGKCHIRPEQWFLQGHFPGNPVVPGVILCEMLAQTSCVLIHEDLKPGQPRSLPAWTRCASSTRSTLATRWRPGFA